VTYNRDRAAAILAERCEMPVEELLTRPPTLSETSIALGLAWQDLVKATGVLESLRRLLDRWT
jgi:hypothetical protein